MTKDWVEVSGFPEYEVHPHEGIRRKGRNSPLKGRTWLGYPKVTLMRDGKKHERRVHKLVAEHFLPNKGRKPIVNHMDSNRSNHSVDNLEWVDNSENQLHRWKTQKKGLKKMKYKKEYGLSKIAISVGLANKVFQIRGTNMKNALNGKGDARKATGKFINSAKLINSKLKKAIQKKEARNEFGKNIKD